ncbi:MAG: hypothetical protein MUF03_05460 [Rubrivivax sp.]|nr:hypothetical protein [Rubrivivax sp.]
MSDQPPLTHHEILALVAPFARAGRHVDLTASDRAARIVAFRDRDHPAAPAGSTGLPALRESLRLEVPVNGGLRLRRVIDAGGGLQASLLAEGDDAGELLARIDAVSPARQLRFADRLAVALEQRVERGGGDDALRMRGAEARVAGLRVHVGVTGVKGFPAELEVEREGDEVRALPPDLLQVLGRAWSRLEPMARGWRGSIDLRGGDLQRSRDAEARLAHTLQHLRDTLAEPPSRFHERHRGRRWWVSMREMVPMAIGLGIVAVALSLRREDPGQAQILALLANLTPPLLMGLFFLRREMPRIGLPRVPWAPAADAWVPQPPAGAVPPDAA